LSVANASPDAFSERLNAAFSTVSAGFTGTGSITALAAGATSNALGVALGTGSAGIFSGTAGVNFVSSGAGTTGAADLALPGQSVALARRVFTPAAAQGKTPI